MAQNERLNKSQVNRILQLYGVSIFNVLSVPPSAFLSLSLLLPPPPPAPTQAPLQADASTGSGNLHAHGHAQASLHGRPWCFSRVHARAARVCMGELRAGACGMLHAACPQPLASLVYAIDLDGCRRRGQAVRGEWRGHLLRRRQPGSRG